LYAGLDRRDAIKHTRISEASPVTLLTTPDLDAWITGPQETVFASARVRRRPPASATEGSGLDA
jgi:hypothetical protein